MNPTSTARSTATPGPAAPNSAPAVVEWLGGGFGFCPSSGEWFTANDTALAVLGWQRDGLTSAAIAQRLAEEFDVSTAAAERDLETFFAAGMGQFATV